MCDVADKERRDRERFKDLAIFERVDGSRERMSAELAVKKVRGRRIVIFAVQPLFSELGGFVAWKHEDDWKVVSTCLASV